jgi:hypothetical protein
MPAGQPTKYKPEYVKQAKKLAKLGATDIEVADFFGVTVRTIHNWKNTNHEFFHALKAGKEESDARVERSLFQRAIGYEQESVKIFMSKDGEPVYAPFREVISPDTTACIFWLKNRKPEEWRDKVDLNHGGEVAVKRVVSDL